jgi:hypothetical protein
VRAIDRFGVLRPQLGQVKNCPLFQSSVPAVAAPVPSVPAAPPPGTPGKGVSLTANVTNTVGETARGILLAPGLDPVYLIATAFGILAGAPASAADPDEIRKISLPMMMTDKEPATIASTMAGKIPGYSKKVWFFKIDRSPVTFAIAPADMVDVDGTPITAVAFQFAPVGSFLSRLIFPLISRPSKLIGSWARTF